MRSLILLVLSGVLLGSCSGNSDKTETAASVAKEWCDLNGKVARAENDAAKESAQTARDQFEKSMREKYKDNQAFLDEVGVEIEKCEDASEGR